MSTTPYMARWNPTSGRILSLACAAALSAAAVASAAVGDVAAKTSPRAVPEAAGRFEGVVFSSEGERVSLRLDAVPLESFCRYLGVVHGINVLASKGLSGNLNGSADGKDLGRVGEILLRRNGFDPTWIGGILVVRPVSSSGSEGTPFTTPQANMDVPTESAMPSPSSAPAFLPMGPSVVEPEAVQNPSPEDDRAQVAAGSGAPVPGESSQTEPSSETAQAMPSGVPMEALPGNAQGGTASPEAPAGSRPPTENVTGATTGAPVE